MRALGRGMGSCKFILSEAVRIEWFLGPSPFGDLALVFVRRTASPSTGRGKTLSCFCMFPFYGFASN